MAESIGTGTNSSERKTMANKVIEGEITQTEKGGVAIVAPTGGEDNVVNTYVKKGAKATFNFTDRMEIIGGSDALQKHAVSTMAGNRIEVVVMFPDFSSETFREKFERNAMIHDVIVAIRKQGKKVTQIKVHGSRDEELDVTTKISTLVENDMHGKLVAVLES